VQRLSLNCPHFRLIWVFNRDLDKVKGFGRGSLGEAYMFGKGAKRLWT